MPVVEIETPYISDPAESTSKLNTYRDGFRILMIIANLFKSEKRLAFFFIGFAICTALAIGLSIPVFQTFLETGLVPHLPTVVFCSALTLFGCIPLICGIVLDTVMRGRTKHLFYLATPSIAREPQRR